MLVIARKVGQTVLLGGDIEVTVSSIRGDQVRLAIQAPRSVSIYRKETVEQVERGNAAAIDTAEGVIDLLLRLPESEGAAVPGRGTRENDSPSGRPDPGDVIPFHRPEGSCHEIESADR